MTAPLTKKKRDYVTQYGFNWGPMEVLRAFADGRYRTILIRTHYDEVQISVSPTGRSIRVSQKGNRRRK